MATCRAVQSRGLGVHEETIKIARIGLQLRRRYFKTALLSPLSFSLDPAFPSCPRIVSQSCDLLSPSPCIPIRQRFDRFCRSAWTAAGSRASGVRPERPSS